MIDWNKQASQLNSDNAFTMKKWTGDMTDTALGELAEFLRGILQCFSFLPASESFLFMLSL